MPYNSRRLSFCLPLFLFSVLASTPSVQAAPRPFWPVPPLSGFNGASFGDLQLGKTTFKQIQARYETGKGAYARSTELSQPKNAAVRVDLLWNKRDNEEVLGAIAVRFDNDGPRLSEIEPLFAPPTKVEAELPVESGETERFYFPKRYEDWSIERFASRGAFSFVMRQGETEFAPLLILTSPANLGGLSERLSREFAEVKERIDPHEDEPKIAEFGHIEVDFDNDLDLPSSEEYRTRDRIKDAYGDGSLRYYRHASGTYRVNMTGSVKRDGGSVSVSVSINGDGPYGALSASGSGSDTWKWSRKDGEISEKRDRDKDRVIDAYRDALREARRAAEDDFARAMRNSGPPPLSSVRQEQWNKIIDDVRGYEPQTAQTNGILR